MERVNIAILSPETLIREILEEINSVIDKSKYVDNLDNLEEDGDRLAILKLQIYELLYDKISNEDEIMEIAKSTELLSDEQVENMCFKVGERLTRRLRLILNVYRCTHPNFTVTRT